MTRSLRALFVVATAVGAVAGCGGGSHGDPEAFCAFVRDGYGLDHADGAVAVADLDALLEVAPDDIRTVVTDLANTTRDLDDIDELDQLFDAAFDPDAQAAREAFDAYAVDECGVPASALPSGSVDSTADLRQDVVDYIDANFGNQTWAPKVQYDIERVDGALDGIVATFVVEASGDEAVSVCNALRPYLYEIKGADGAIAVLTDDLVLARSAGPDATCVAL